MFDITPNLVKQAIEILKRANTELRPERISEALGRELFNDYAEAEKLCAYGRTALAQKFDSAEDMARVTGTSIGKAKDAVATAQVLKESILLDDALRYGEVSLDQAVEIARAEESAPGAAKHLIPIAQSESFQVLEDKARKTKLEAEQHNGLAERQRKARSGRDYTDELGMINVHLKFEPHVGTPIVNRAHAEAKRFAKAARALGRDESYECHLADAYAKMLSGKGTPSTTRPEMVVVVSHEVAKRGWQEIRAGEVCKIPVSGRSLQGEPKRSPRGRR
ncbi:MAG: hypothetical protein ACRD1T_26060 [Acidimicrobiia bacterium]